MSQGKATLKLHTNITLSATASASAARGGYTTTRCTAGALGLRCRVTSTSLWYWHDTVYALIAACERRQDGCVCFQR